MEWMIASDSSCEIRTLPDTAPGVQFALVPFKIRVGEREFVDLPTLNTKAMLQAMTDYNGASAPEQLRVSNTKICFSGCSSSTISRAASAAL